MEITDVIGNLGRLQCYIIILLICRGLPTAWQILALPFLAPDTDHWCAKPHQLENWTVTQWKNISIPFDTNKQEFSQCLSYSYTLVQLPDSWDVIIDQNVTVPCTKWDYSSRDNTIITQWDLFCDREWLVSMNQTVFMLGMLFGVFIAGHLGDKFGRRPVLLGSLCLIIVSNYASAAVPNLSVFLHRPILFSDGGGRHRECRCLSLCSFLPKFSVFYLMETISPEYRAWVSVSFSFGRIIGLIILPGLAWLIRDWQYFEAFTACSWLPMLIAWWFLPESPRWLLTRKRYTDAENTIRKFLSVNKLSVSNLNHTMKILETKNELEKKTKSTLTSLDLFRTPRLRRITIEITFVFFVSSFLYYALTFDSARLGGSMYINFLISAAVEIPVCVAAPLLIKFVKRKPPFVVCFVVTSIACVLVIAVPEDMVATKILLTMIGKMFISTTDGIMFLYGGEVFPTVIRTVGVGTSIMCSKIGGAIAPFVRELSKSTHVAVPSVIYGVLSIIAAIMVFLLPETFNRQLPDTILEIENPEKLTVYETKGPVEETELPEPVTA
ncbi:solute carrier family 22 member 6-B-like [Tachypleus tridentatus]|uniref:solute carrier family 22 member 6-B-like n=1 Tax=Tachypleus tridentatus TaxID=6853 RepID=UPI003FD0917F